MEVHDGEQVFCPVFDPPLFFEELTLGTVSVSAGVVRDQLRPAVPALVHVAALIRSPAGLDRPHGVKPVCGHGMGVPVQRTVLAEDVRDLKLSGFSRAHGEATVRGASVFSVIFSAGPDPKDSRSWRGSCCSHGDRPWSS